MYCLVIGLDQKTGLAQKLLLRVQLTGGPYSYRTCINSNTEQLPLEYMVTLKFETR